MGIINRGKFVHKFIVATVHIIYITQRVPIKSTKLSSKTGMSLSSMATSENLFFFHFSRQNFMENSQARHNDHLNHNGQLQKQHFYPQS